MIKIRIPADQISNFKALAKAFSTIIQDKSSARLRGRTLLNAFAQAAGHRDYNSLRYDAQTYGSGEFSWSSLPAKLSSGLSVQLGSDRFAVLTMLSEATLQVPALASAIAVEAVGAYNPFAGVKPNLPGLPSPESQLMGGTFNDAVRVKPDASTFYIDGKSDVALRENVAKAVFANATDLLNIDPGDHNIEMPYPVFTSESGLPPEFEVSIATAAKGSRRHVTHPASYTFNDLCDCASVSLSADDQIALLVLPKEQREAFLSTRLSTESVSGKSDCRRCYNGIKRHLQSADDSRLAGTPLASKRN